MIIKTSRKDEVIDITDQLNNELRKLQIEKGICHIFLQHTTAGLAVVDLDAGGTDLDYLAAFRAIVPSLKYRHPHNPQHMPDHILSALIGTSLTVPVLNGQLALGTWQRLVLFEFNGPRQCQIIITCLSQ